MDVARAERLARPTWINARTSLGILLFASSVLLGHRVLSQAANPDLVWAAVRDLPQGYVLTPDDLRAVELHLGTDTLSRYWDTTADLAGTVLTRPISEGEFVARSGVDETPVAGAERSITIPIPAEHAIGGDLAAGDRVDIYATFDAGDARARTSLLAREIEILEIVHSTGLAFDDEAFVGVTVGVSSEDAARLAFAIRTAELDLVKIIKSGHPSAASTVSEEDFR